jgi:hypothetical protein
MDPNDEPAREYVVARKVLLDALETLEPHLGALILVGAQAVYLHAPAGVAQPPYTTDGDLAIDPELLATKPDIGAALEASGFRRGPNPGAWLSHEGVGVDLMVAAGSQASSKHRSALLAGHPSYTARRTRGLEVALRDHSPQVLHAFDPSDRRSAKIQVAGPAALVVSKLVKLQERLDVGKPGRVVAKDAGDLLRLLRACDAQAMGSRLASLRKERNLAITIDPALACLMTQLAVPRSPLVTLTLEALAGTEPESQVVDSLRTLGGRLLDAARGRGITSSG